MSDLEQSSPNKKITTKQRILDAAEELFSEKGFAETSMRDITSAADVNLASVNYHFGSKDELIHAVFLRTVEPLAQALEQNLNDLIAENYTGDDVLERSLRVLVKTGLDRSREMKSGGGIFIRLLSRAYADPEAKVRNYLAAKYSTALVGYVQLLGKALPGVKSEEIYWRAYAMLGSLMFIMSAEPTLRNIAEKNYHFDTTDDSVVENLVKFLAAGFRA